MNSQGIPINYMREVTNNASLAKACLMKYRSLDIACVNCLKFYRYFTYKALKIITNNTLVCNECSVDSMIPITTASCLYEMEPEERQEQLNIWHHEWFTPIEAEPEYEDYEYDEWNYEETKEAPGLEDNRSPTPTLTLPND
jgi:hypothetical protein